MTPGRTLLARLRGRLRQDADPDPLFFEGWYRRRYPDVEAAIAAGFYPSGWEHYRTVGRAEGRAANPLWVDEGWYLDRYPDAAAARERGEVGSAREHYLAIGAREGRDPHLAFAERWYRERYPDVEALIRAGRWPAGYVHFLAVGIEEGRRPHPEYDETLYRLWNADVDAAASRGELLPYLHLVPQGLAEGRRWRVPSGPPTVRRAATALAMMRLDELLASSRRLAFSPAADPAAAEVVSVVAVSVVLVLWNRAELTLACLESLLAVREPALELIVVDNASTDRTAALLERLDGVRLLRQDENLGFTRAVQAGAALACGRHLLLLNSDAEVLPGAIAAAAARLDADPRIGAVGGRVLALDGTLEEAGSIVWRDGTTEGYGRGDDPRSGAYLFPRPVDYVSGVFLLTPRATFERLGGLDLRFTPAYYEEADYCFRLRRHGLEVVYEPAAVVRHFGSGSLPSEARLYELLSKNRRTFVELHSEALASAPEPAPERRFVRSSREAVRGRILWLDDEVPVESLGAGFPRLGAILLALRELGWGVSFFATHPRDPAAALPREPLAAAGVELVAHLGRERFADFWKERRTSYDAVVVSRQHNLAKLLESGLDLGADRPTRLVFDCEALVSERLSGRQAGGLAPSAPPETALSLDDELALAARADAVWTASASEAGTLRRRCVRKHRPQVDVVGHAVEPRPGDRPFAARRGLLFVGRLVEPWSPNVDGLAWFLAAVLPAVRAALGEDLPMTVAGEMGSIELPRPPGVTFLGPVADLAPLYDAHRLFVAPARFGAGIPLKVLGAAAHGLPVVASSLLARQLGWEAELADGGDDPARFAAAVVDLYRDPAAWAGRRAAALDRVAADCSPASLRRALESALAARAED